ncbi:MAG: branched-chain amino acid ABC transporter permease [Dehalococcoidales bacterium]|nr:branched-chain amino acid ABC transporter permease [Dehalococcoidales bacterium]
MRILSNYNKWYFPAVVLFLAVVILALLPLYAPGYPVVLFAIILMFVVLSVSWAIFSGSTGYISLATAAFFGVGVYATAILGRTLPLPLVILIGGLLSSCLAAITGAITLRLRGIYFTIFTFGLLALMQTFVLWWEININHVRGRMVVLVDNTTIFYYILGILVLLMITAYLIKRSKYGLALQGIGLDEEATAHTGINVTLLKIFAFSGSAFFMGAAGAIMATRISYIDPYIAFNTNYSFFPVLMALFGGAGNLYGPVIGAVIFAYLEETLLTKFPYYYMLVFGLVMVIAIIFMPKGVIGLIVSIRRRRRKVVRG